MFDRPSVVATRLKRPLQLALGVLCAWLLLQALVWRSGLYWQLAEPDSNTGAVTHALALLELAQREGRRSVLVLGDSRIGEGFSGPLASARGEFEFINVSVPGSTPRTWYYLLREIDRRGIDYAAVVLGMTYVSTDRRPTRDWPLDPLHQVALVGWRDIPGYAAEAGEGEPRRRAWEALLLPELVAQQDARAFAAAPLKRWHALRDAKTYAQDTLDYPGRDGRMPDADPDERARLETLAPMPDDLARLNAGYLAHWIDRIGERSAARGAPLIVFAVPRSPYPDELPSPVTPDWPRAVELPAGLLVPLEAPAYFFDRLHLNREGRERMSVAVADAVRAVLAGAVPNPSSAPASADAAASRARR